MSVRISLSEDDYEHLLKVLERNKHLKDTIEASAKFKDGRADNLRKVAKKKTSKVQQKIRNAVQKLRENNEVVTRYSVAKETGSTWHTVNKYKELLKEGEQLSLLDREGE
jgi:phosphorylcholine metabolism protein LicD